MSSSVFAIFGKPHVVGLQSAQFALRQRFDVDESIAAPESAATISFNFN